MGGCILEFNCERTTRVISSVFVYHLDDPDLRVEIIFTKQGTTENKRYRHLCTLVLAVGICLPRVQNRGKDAH